MSHSLEVDALKIVHLDPWLQPPSKGETFACLEGLQNEVASEGGANTCLGMVTKGGGVVEK